MKRSALRLLKVNALLLLILLHYDFYHHRTTGNKSPDLDADAEVKGLIMSGIRRGSALLWDVTQRISLINYRRFGTTYRYNLQGWIDGLYRNVGT
jgi:hypothetical protein